MTELVLSLVAGLGVFYLYSAYAFGWHQIALAPPGPRDSRRHARQLDDWLAQAGLEDIKVGQFVAVSAGLFALGGAVAFSIFGGVVPALLVAAATASIPAAAYRVKRRKRRERAHEAWPRIIEEMRVLTGAAGRSIPQALFDVGGRGPEEMRPAFAAAQREWLLTTDFERTLDVLKARLADPTADITCETLLVAHRLGGTDLDQRLAALADDRVVDREGRKDAVARQAGARFARWFTLVVPLGMALVGMSIGDGRAAFATTYGQVLVAGALLLILGCWVAASRIMALPAEQRVFPESSAEWR